jgi:SSS family solute:Na+ symporter
MNSTWLALPIIFAILVGSALLAFWAGRRVKMDLEQWAVAGHGFGVILVWILMAGECYTIFSFLGASGWAYTKGAPAMYIMVYLTLLFVFSFFLLPQLWEFGRRHGVQTQPDFFLARFGNKWLAGLVAVIGIACITPYVQLQLKGLGIIMETASYSAIGRVPAMLVAFGLVAAFVFTSGIRGIALVAVVKDILMVVAVLFLGIGLPCIYFGGIGKMFAAMIQANPAHLTLPGSTPNMGYGWFITTIVLTTLGGAIWPHSTQATMTAKSSDTLRRNACIMPIYTIMMPFVFFVGLTALLVLPGLRDGDLSLLEMVRKTYPPWFLGVLGAAGCLAAMLPSASLLLSAALMFSKNIYKTFFARNMTDDRVAIMSRLVVIVVTAISLVFAICCQSTIVGLLLLGYAGVTQFLPGMLFGLYWKRANVYGVFTGLVLGIGMVSFLMLTKRDPFLGCNAGFLALGANFAATILISLATPARQPRPA